ncbi:uncharacterized protein [Littorina saxatilis]|uniref:Uncharacterized protein n=1 Tax=Littorina saxatilis TaxID=31220 RepID=A0AAN9BA55_9CAEN
MVVEEPLLRLGVILAMAAGGVVFLLLVSLMMYACCRSHRGRVPPDRPDDVHNITSVYNPNAVSYHHEESDVNRLQVPTTTPRSSIVSETESNEVIIIPHEADRRGVTPPPSYEEVVRLPFSDFAKKEHSYSA